MEQQNDWFTGMDYYNNYREKEISVDKQIIDAPFKQGMHEQVEMLYVFSGNGIITVNGCDYQAKEGSFFCLYTHHFYSINSITESLEVVFVKFYIGLFMYMSWEKHPKRANGRLVYDTCPVVQLCGQEKAEIEDLVKKIVEENQNHRFASLNVVVYKTLEMFAYFCRYSYEQIGVDKREEGEIWTIIKKITLSPSINLDIKKVADDLNCTQRTLNLRIKQTCGYTFFQLKQFAKILNACALMHFPELSIEYISDILGFSSTQTFYRVFVQYCGITPREYQSKYIGSEEKDYIGTSMVIQLLQYMHMNFMNDISINDICKEFCVKEYTVNSLFETMFGTSFRKVVTEIRISYSIAFLQTGKYSVLEVSMLCGFNSLSTFQRAFKEFLNQTPSEYMKCM